MAFAVTSTVPVVALSRPERLLDHYVEQVYARTGGMMPPSGKGGYEEFPPEVLKDCQLENIQPLTELVPPGAHNVMLTYAEENYKSEITPHQTVYACFEPDWIIFGDLPDGPGFVIQVEGLHAKLISGPQATSMPLATRHWFVAQVLHYAHDPVGHERAEQERRIDMLIATIPRGARMASLCVDHTWRGEILWRLEGHAKENHRIIIDFKDPACQSVQVGIAGPRMWVPNPLYYFNDKYLAKIGLAPLAEPNTVMDPGPPYLIQNHPEEE